LTTRTLQNHTVINPVNQLGESILPENTLYKRARASVNKYIRDLYPWSPVGNLHTITIRPGLRVCSMFIIDLTGTVNLHTAVTAIQKLSMAQIPGEILFPINNIPNVVSGLITVTTKNSRLITWVTKRKFELSTL